MKMFFNSLSGEYGTVTPPTPSPYPTTIVDIDSSNWIIGSRNNTFVRISTGLIEVSNDRGSTYPYSQSWSNADYITSAYCFSNGNILLFSNEDKLYLTDITLSSITQKTVYQTDGVTPYATPNAPNYQYFYPLMTNDYRDSNMLVWGNFAYSTNAAEVLFFTADYGNTIQVAIDFSGVAGVNRMHSCEYNKYNDKWYVTPCGNDGFFYECTYSGGTWSSSVVNFTPSGVTTPPTTLKPTGYYFREVGSTVYIYWGSKDSANTASERGIWRSDVTTFADSTTHERVCDTSAYDYKFLDLRVDEFGQVIGTMRIEGNTESCRYLFMADDWGHGDWYMKDYGPTVHFTYLTAPDSQGYYRLDTKIYNTTLKGSTMFIRVGSDLLSQSCHQHGTYQSACPSKVHFRHWKGDSRKSKYYPGSNTRCCQYTLLLAK